MAEEVEACRTGSAAVVSTEGVGRPGPRREHGGLLVAHSTQRQPHTQRACPFVCLTSAQAPCVFFMAVSMCCSLGSLGSAPQGAYNTGNMFVDGVHLKVESSQERGPIAQMTPQPSRDTLRISMGSWRWPPVRAAPVIPRVMSWSQHPGNL